MVDFEQLAAATDDWSKLVALRILARDFPAEMFQLRMAQAGGVYRQLASATDEELLNTLAHHRQQQAQAEAPAEV